MQASGLRIGACNSPRGLHTLRQHVRLSVAELDLDQQPQPQQPSASSLNGSVRVEVWLLDSFFFLTGSQQPQQQRHQLENRACAQGQAVISLLQCLRRQRPTQAHAGPGEHEQECDSSDGEELEGPAGAPHLPGPPPSSFQAPNGEVRGPVYDLGMCEASGQRVAGNV